MEHHPIARVAVLLCTVAVSLHCARFEAPRRAAGYTISGRVIDSRGLPPRGIMLLVGKEEGDDGFASDVVALDPDGTFVTRALDPGTYVLYVEPSYESQKNDATVEGGLAAVSLGTSDLTGVTLTTRAGTAISGRFRMETDNPSAEWPPHIAVLAILALDGKGMMTSKIAEGAPGGRFVLRDAYGPRVIHCGYSLAPGNPWWPSRVFLDGVDMTNVPIDFSEKPNSQLELVFTQHPSSLRGAVADVNGNAVPSAWVIVFGADRSLWQRWAPASQAVRASADGRFSLTSTSGRYLARAFPASAFRSERAALSDFERLAKSATPIELADRERKTLNLVVASDK